ncbi:hypothetical protein LCGC14_1838610 [marine sediment metagenome]|uniref:Uncharacterized protein n=1 Tax=marine sediment metagenome TaxID=412755 RepID=A0A0F9GDZ2_9ZZZZ
MNDNVVQFPRAKPTDGLRKPAVPLDLKFTIGDDEFYASSVARPELLHHEWEVHTLSGRAYVAGPHYWSPLLVTAEEGLGNLIQETSPINKMIFEIINPSTEKVEERWEFHQVYLSTETVGTDFVIVFRNATQQALT